MLFKIIDPHRGNHLAFDTDIVDIVRVQQGSLSDSNYVLALYTANEDAPVLEYDISKLFIEERLSLFEAVCTAVITDSTEHVYTLPR